MQVAPIFSINEFYTAKEIVVKHALEWRPQDIGNLAKCELIGFVSRGTMKLFNESDVLKLYQKRVNVFKEEAA